MNISEQQMIEAIRQHDISRRDEQSTEHYESLRGRKLQNIYDSLTGQEKEPKSARRLTGTPRRRLG